MIHLRAFGSFDLHDDGESLHNVLSQSKRAALLAYLVLARPGALHRRDALLALFWPESDEARGRNALSQSLTFLRRELPEGVLVTRGVEEVGVDAGRVRCDVAAFEAAVVEGRWAEALELYRGPLLEGLHVAGAAPFMDWLDQERERLRALAAGAAWRYAYEHIAAGELTEADRLAQHALRLVPTDESQVREFIKALADAGDRAAALRFYEKFAEVLAEELEVEPAPETVAVVDGVRARSEPAEATSPMAAMDGARLTRPVTGEPGVPQPVPRPVNESEASPVSSFRYNLRRWVRGKRALAFAAVAALAFIVYGQVRTRWTGGPGTLMGEGKAAKYDPVLVADFANASDPVLGAMVSEWLRFDLDQSDIIRPVGPAAVGAALRRMERDSSLVVDARTAHEIAMRDGYPLVVVGDVHPTGQGYVILARLEAGESGEVLGRFRAVAASDADMAHALEGMGRQIRRRIGESLRAIRRNAPLEQVPTSSLEALRLYTDAMRANARTDAMHLRPRPERDWRRDLDVIPLLERAIAIDTTFAAAYWALGSILHADFIDWSRQTALTQKAYEHRDRLNDYQRFIVEESYMFDSLANWADTTKPQPDECDIEEPLRHLAEAYLRRHPEDPRPLRALGNHQWRTGHLEEALASYRRLTEMDPSVYSGWNLLLYGQLTVGDIKGARETLHDWRKTLPELGAREFDFDEASVAAYQGEYARADSVFEGVVASYKDDRHVQVNAAKLDAVLGRMNEAWQHYQYAIRRVGRAGYPAGALLWVTHEALIRLVAMEDSAGAVADVKAALAALPDTLNLADTWTDVGLVYALAGDPARAQAQLDSLTRHGRGNWSSSRGVLGAAIALAEDKPEQALELLAATQIPCTTFNNSADFHLGPRLRRVLAGRAYEALHRPDAAIAMYEAYLTDPPNIYPANLDAVFLFDTLERLGTLHEARGDSAEAATYYARAADLWKDADPELQPRVLRLRERAAALRFNDRPRG